MSPQPFCGLSRSTLLAWQPKRLRRRYDVRELEATDSSSSSLLPVPSWEHFEEYLYSYSGVNTIGLRGAHPCSSWPSHHDPPTSFQEWTQGLMPVLILLQVFFYEPYKGFIPICNKSLSRESKGEWGPLLFELNELTGDWVPARPKSAFRGPRD